MKTKLLFYGIFLFAITMIAFSACVQDTPDKATRIQFAIEEKANQYRKKELAKCKENLKSAAEMEVDSILRYRSKQQKVDTISPPSRFSRPRKPNLRFEEFKEPKPIPIDSLPEN